MARPKFVPRERPRLSAKKVEDCIRIREEIFERALSIAHTYFSDHPNSEASRDSDLRIVNGAEFHIGSFVRVAANDELGHYLDSVDVTLEMIVHPRYEDLAKKWCLDERDKREKSRELSEMNRLQELIRKYPEDAQKALNEIGMRTRR